MGKFIFSVFLAVEHAFITSTGYALSFIFLGKLCDPFRLRWAYRVISDSTGIILAIGVIIFVCTLILLIRDILQSDGVLVHDKPLTAMVYVLLRALHLVILFVSLLVYILGLSWLTQFVLPEQVAILCSTVIMLAAYTYTAFFRKAKRALVRKR
jgi:hypothetical protein